MYLFFNIELIIYQKKISAEDLFVELYCEEVETPPTPCSICKDPRQQTDAGGKINFYAISCFSKKLHDEISISRLSKNIINHYYYYFSHSSLLSCEKNTV